jgi:hypothetical protein
VLRYCLPPSVRRTLDELPESLDETYGRVLKEIKKPNRDHACRLLQCLIVAIRPLDVKELAEVLAVDFDGADGIPKLKTNWRWEDEEQALLSSCSSLITIVEADDSRVVQFSHFSVRVPDLGTARYSKYGCLALSYRSRACTHDSGASMHERFAPARPEWYRRDGVPLG